MNSNLAWTELDEDHKAEITKASVTKIICRLNSYLAWIQLTIFVYLSKHEHINKSCNEAWGLPRGFSSVWEPFDEDHDAEITKDTHQEDHLWNELT